MGAVFPGAYSGGGGCAAKAGTHVKAWQCDASMDMLKLHLQSWNSLLKKLSFAVHCGIEHNSLPCLQHHLSLLVLSEQGVV